MKKILLSLSLVTVALASNAQNCSELFISKYLSNGSNNKAIEIYNPTASPIVLNGSYYVARYKTGTAGTAIPMTLSDSVWLKGTIPAYGTFLVANPEVTPSSSNSNAVCDVRIRNKAVTPNGQLGNLYGTYGSTTGDPTYFKGSDVITIEKKVGSTITIVDLFGRRGDVLVNSAGTGTTAWSTIAPYTGGTGMGKWITKGYLMVRKASIQTGVTTDPSSFDPLAQWDTIAKPHTAADTTALYARIGSHSCACAPAGLKEVANTVKVSVFPNPMNNDVTTLSISSLEAIKFIEIYDIEGKLITQKSFTSADKEIELKGLNLTSGFYTVKVYHSNGKLGVNRFSKL